MAVVSRAQWNEIADRTKVFLRDRATAYKLFFGSRTAAYGQIVRQPAGQIIMADLLKFAHWVEGIPLKVQNEFDRGRVIGRQDVIRRIQQHINLTSDQLFALYNGQQVPQLIRQEEDDDD